MSITITCPSCQREYKVNESMGGKRVRCQGCSGAISVPALEAVVEEGGMADLAQVASAASRSGPKSQPMAGQRISHDPGPFQTVSDSFFLPGGNYFAQKSFFVKGSQFYGIAFASPNALYLVKVGSTGGGPGLIRKALYEAMADESTLRTCTVKELPETVRQYVDPNGVTPDAEVVVLPKQIVTFVRSDVMTESIAFMVGKQAFSIVAGVFTINKRKKQLTELGWQLNTPLNPPPQSQ